MNEEKWVEIFTEINDRIPTDEEIQAGIQAGEITESGIIDNSLESTQTDSQTRNDEDLSQEVEDVQDKQEFSNDYTFVVHAEQRILLMMNDARIVKKF